MNTTDKYSPKNKPSDLPAPSPTSEQENKPIPATDTSGKCGLECEVYSRVCGYFRPVKNWNKGKREEFNHRKNYNFYLKNDLMIK